MVREVLSVESRIEEVTVYENGARIRRVAILRAPVPSVVRLVGLPLAVIDDTVRSEVEGTAVVTSIRVGLDVPSGEPAAEESAELRAARMRVARGESEVDRLRGALECLAGAPLIEDDPSDDPPAAWQAIVNARRELVAMRARREATLREQFAAAARELEEATRALEIVVEREQRASTAKAARLHEVRKYAELELSATSGDVSVRVEYQVAAARWAPSYVARLDPGARSESGPLHSGSEQARFELRAVVAQASGEDWTDVALRVSTAQPEQFTQLPELHPQKIGRRQQEPMPRGFRAPPSGADALYADYDRGFPRAQPIGAQLFDDSTYQGYAPPPPPASIEAMEELAEQVWDEDSSRAKERYTAAAPALARQRASAPALAKKAPSLVGGLAGAVAAPFGQAVSRGAPGGGGAVEYRNEMAPMAPTPVTPPAPTPRLDYGNLRMAPPSSARRGTLIPAPANGDAGIATRVAAAAATVRGLELPPGHDDEWAETYDYAFASDGNIEIKSDAAWHSIAITVRASTAKIRHVAVPREQADVFRVAAITNPFDGPLLPGPIDVYDRGQFVVTSEVDYTSPGGVVDIGLGVDPAVKIARNVEYHEEASGMLRGALRLIHAISIDVENLAQRPIQLEVRERVPVAREGDDDVEIAVGKVDPPWERYTPDTDAPAGERLRGGFRWQITVPGSTKKLLRAGYEVKIAGKHELVGGNRREP